MKSFLAVILGMVVLGAVGATSFDEGKDAFGRREWRQAAVLLGKFLQENPDDAQAASAAFLRGVALYQQGDFKASLDTFQKLDRAWPLSSVAKRLPYWKGTAALAAGQAVLAERELAAQAQYSEEPFTTRALLNLALARVILNKDAEAVTALGAFTKATKEPDLAAQAWAVWGDLDKKAGRADQALDHYRSSWTAQPGSRWALTARTQALDLLLSLKRYPEARTLLEASVTLFPSEGDRWDARRVEVARGTGDTAGLFQALEALWAREPDPRKKQDFAANRARSAEESGHPEALWWLRASVGPDEALGSQAILRHAFLLEGASQGLSAAAALEAWAATHPGAPAASREEVRGRAAQDRWSAGDGPGARKVWGRLIAESPKSPRMPVWLLGRGRVALESADTGAALVDFGRLLKEFPQVAEAPEARYQTGLVYLQRQEPARAEGWFYGLVQDLKSGDLYQRSLLARGISFVNSGQTDLARGSLQRLIREVPGGPWTGESWAALGRNALQARLFDEASDAFVQAEQTLSDPGEKAKALWSQAEARSGQGQTGEASAAYARYATSYSGQPRAAEALYRRGSVWFGVQDWQQALDIWMEVLPSLQGEFLTQAREGVATSLLRLGRVQEGWDKMEVMEAATPSPEAWYRWGQAATAAGQGDWAVKAFQFLLQHHPESPVAEAALPRAAGALLGSGKPDEALMRYADYFKKFGRQASSAPVARAAAAAAQPFPSTLEALVKASASWSLAPEVAVEFAMAWAQSRLDADTEKAQAELQELSRTAPWTSQRSEALAILGRWNLGRGNLEAARNTLEAAAGLGDDLSVFRARWALAQVTQKEGDLAAAARQRESAEKAAGPGVPMEFRIQVLREAVETWNQAGRPDEAKRVQNRIDSLS